MLTKDNKNSLFFIRLVDNGVRRLDVDWLKTTNKK